MVKYGLRTEQVVIDGEIYKLHPLKGKYFADFMELASLMEATKDNTATLKSDDFAKLVEMCVASIMYGDKGANKDEVEQFVSQNLVTFLPELMKVNVPKQ